MATHSIKDDRIYTYADYLSWPENERWEIIGGTAYAMAPPSADHQRIVRNLTVAFALQLKGKSCEVFMAPFGVTFANQLQADKNTTVVEPDISVICDQSKITSRGCHGSPDLIVEVLSRSTASHDVIKKRRLYEQNSVLEYWIADPSNQIITRYCLNREQGKYEEADYFGRDDTIRPVIFAELAINLAEIFPDSDEQ